MEQYIKVGRQEREKKVGVIAERLDSAENFVVSDYRGLTVSQISQLRRDIASLGASLHVEKNKLIKIALEKNGVGDVLNEYLQGPTAMVYVSGDISPVLKVLFKFASDDEFSFSVKGAYVDGEVLDERAALAVSKLASREQLIAQLMSVMNAPVTNMALGLKDVIVRAARALNAVAEKKE